MLRTNEKDKVQTYKAPKAKVFEVRIQSCILSNNGFNNQNGTETFGYDEDEDL